MQPIWFWADTARVSSRPDVAASITFSAIGSGSLPGKNARIGINSEIAATVREEISGKDAFPPQARI
jgi:hypothetical protein